MCVHNQRMTSVTKLKEHIQPIVQHEGDKLKQRKLLHNKLRQLQRQLLMLQQRQLQMLQLRKH